MFNASVTAIPGYLVIAKLNLIDSQFSVILPAFASTLGLYLMKQFMDQMVPSAVISAARIDGAILKSRLKFCIGLKFSVNDPITRERP